MGCVYNILGRTFSSELELNNFLLNNKNSVRLGKISDIVFSLNSRFDETNAKLEEKLVEVKKIQDIKRSKDSYLTEEEIENVKKPYVGVTKFLTMGRKSTVTPGKEPERWIPEFILDNFRENKIKQ